MDLEGIMLSKINQIQKDKYLIILLIHGLEKRKKESTHTGKLKDTENRWVIARSKRSGVEDISNLLFFCLRVFKF